MISSSVVPVVVPVLVLLHVCFWDHPNANENTNTNIFDTQTKIGVSFRILIDRSLAVTVRAGRRVMFLKITGYVPPGSYITLIGRPISDDVFSNGVMFLTREHNTNWGT